MFNDDNKDGIGMPLLSVDIARGRDHGLAPYTLHYRRCTDRRVNNWLDLMPTFSYTVSMLCFVVVVLRNAV